MEEERQAKLYEEVPQLENVDNQHVSNEDNMNDSILQSEEEEYEIIQTQKIEDAKTYSPAKSAIQKSMTKILGRQKTLKSQDI